MRGHPLSGLRCLILVQVLGSGSWALERSRLGLGGVLPPRPRRLVATGTDPRPPPGPSALGRCCEGDSGIPASDTGPLVLTNPHLCRCLLFGSGPSVPS